MNKAKIIFTSLILLAAIGGVFAVKATKFTALWLYTDTAVGTFTFTTAAGGPIYTALGVTYCTTLTQVTRAVNNCLTLGATTVRAGIITGTAPNGLTSTKLLPFRDCETPVTVFCTDEL